MNSHWCAQVPLLLSLGELEGALTKAIDSGDADLVYLALFRSATLLALPTWHACLAILSEACLFLLQAVLCTQSVNHAAGVQQQTCSEKYQVR